MIEVTYTTYSKILDKRFVNTKLVKTMQDFNLFACSLNLHLVSVQTRNIG